MIVAEFSPNRFQSLRPRSWRPSRWSARCDPKPSCDFAIAGCCAPDRSVLAMKAWSAIRGSGPAPPCSSPCFSRTRSSSRYGAPLWSVDVGGRSAGVLLQPRYGIEGPARSLATSRGHPRLLWACSRGGGPPQASASFDSARRLLRRLGRKRTVPPRGRRHIAAVGWPSFDIIPCPPQHDGPRRPPR